jgi:hemerythrin-like domain-containing protein
MEALHIIGEEHQSLAAILHAMRFMQTETLAGRMAPDLPLLQLMVHYLDAYAERQHHPKEDILFERLVQRSGEAALVLSVLSVQHAEAPFRIARLQSALDALSQGETGFAGFAQAFEQYAEFYRDHMMLEEEHAMPLLSQHLTPEDWVEMDQAFRQFSSGKKPVSGQEENFTALFSRLVEMAPAPIGLAQPSQKI